MQLSKPITKAIFWIFKILQGIIFQVFLLYVRNNLQKEIEIPYQTTVHRSDLSS